MQVTLGPGQTQTVTLTSLEPISTQLTGDVLDVVVALNGSIAKIVPVQVYTTPGTGQAQILVSGVTVEEAQAGQTPVVMATVVNTGGSDGSTIVSGQITTPSGALVEEIVPQATPTLHPGEVYQLTLYGSDILPASYAGQTLVVTLSTAQGGPSASAQFTVQGTVGVPQLAIVNATVTSAVVGQFGQATVIVANIGTAPGSGTVTGVTTFLGQTVGHWNPISVPTLQPGQSVQLQTTTEGLLYQGYVGDTLTAVFQLGASAITVPFVVQAPS